MWTQKRESPLYIVIDCEEPGEFYGANNSEFKTLNFSRYTCYLWIANFVAGCRSHIFTESQ